jgi:AraC-like DNA-binding protein
MTQDCTLASKQISECIGPVPSFINYFTDLLQYCNYDMEKLSILPGQLNNILDNFPRFSSITLVSESGRALSLARLKGDTIVLIRLPEKPDENKVEIQKFYKSRDSVYHLFDEKSIKSDFKILDKFWVQNAMKSDSVYCSDPYEFYYSDLPGITISKRFLPNSDPENYLIVGIDILIQDIFSAIKLPEVGFGRISFLLNNNFNVIPDPENRNYFGEQIFLEGNQKYNRELLIERFREKMITIDDVSDPFDFRAFGKHWFAELKRIPVSENKSIYIGIIYPDYFFQQTGKKLMIILLASFIIILALSIYLLYSISEQHKKNLLLIEKNFALAKSNYSVNKLRNRIIEEIDKDKQTVKNENSNVSSITAIRIIDEIELLINEKFYLDPDINLYSLAKMLDTNTSYLSKVINEYLGKSFSEFLKDLRINEAIIRMGNSKIIPKYSMDGFAHELGFKSKSSFNIAFKKYTGMTPSDFISSLQ